MEARRALPNIEAFHFDPTLGGKQLTAKQICGELWGQVPLCISIKVQQEIFVTLTQKSGIPVDTALADLAVDCRAIREAAITAREFQLPF